MTATTNTIVLDIDGETREYSGALFAEETYHADTGDPGVVIQYARQPHQEEAETEFVPGAEIDGVYDDIADDSATDEFRRHVRNDP